MRTNDLIDRLVGDLNPVVKLPSIQRRFMVWMAWSLVITGAVLAITGIRIHPVESIMRPYYLIETILIVLFSILASIHGLKASVPGDDNWPRGVVPVVLAAWVGLSLGRLGLHVFNEGPSAFIPDIHLSCAVITIVVSIAASLPLVFYLRRAMALDPAWCGALLGISSGGIAMVTVQLYCVYRGAAHVVFWHVAPVALAVGLGVGVSQLLLAPWRRKVASSSLK